MLEKIYLSDSGPKVSPAVYGFHRWDNASGSDPKAMEKIVNLCLELGINTFDHADVYGGYACEETFGKLIKNKSVKREEVVLFTKCGVVSPHASRPDIRLKHIDTSASHIDQSIERSLKNLQVDYIDIFLLDHLDPISNLEETASTLVRLRSSGKIKNVGIANFSVFQHQLLATYLPFPIVTHHIELNLLNTSALDNGQIDFLKQHYTRPLASAPLAEGRIENGLDPLAVTVRARLNDLSKKYDLNIESIAVAWLVKLGALPLIGTTNEQRIRNIANAFSVTLDHQDWYDLYAVSK